MTDSSIKKYAFVLGREQDLCLAELRAVLARFCFDFSDLSVSKNIAFINLNHTNGEQNESANGESANFDDLVFNLISTLGGTTKIFEIIDDGGNLKKKISDLVADRSQKTSGKFNFGFSAYGKHNPRSLNALGLNIKKELKGVGSLRFIALREQELSTIISSKNKLVAEGLEVGFFDEGVGILVAVTDPEGWSERDYDKPASDKHSGMLPPKLARIMLNLALGEASRISYDVLGITDHGRAKVAGKVPDQTLKIENCKIGNSQATLVVDPFCGSGNVVLEAMMLGLDVFASDLSEKAVEDTRKNVEWLRSCGVIPTEAEGSCAVCHPEQSEGSINPKISPTVRQSSRGRNDNIKIIHADATGPELLSTLNLELSTRDYDRVVVVGEPYLGEPKKYTPTANAVKGEYAKIKELYLEFLKNMVQLSDGSIVKNNRAIEQSSNRPIVFCLVFPLVETAEGKPYSLYFDSVDEIRKIGYTELKLPLVYGRDYQVVKRQICLLQATKHQDTNIK